jgi:hypothetical protein
LCLSYFYLSATFWRQRQHYFNRTFKSIFVFRYGGAA